LPLLACQIAPPPGLDHTHGFGNRAHGRKIAIQQSNQQNQDAPLLEVQGLTVFRGERLIFRNIGFVLPAGGALMVVGPNGAGKSTLLRVLAGLLRPVAGRFLWQGRDALTDPVQHARRVAYLGHADGVKPTLTAAENLRFFARIGKGSVEAALAAVGLAALRDLPARLLSAGQRRRLALARLVLSSAPLWLLDEPTLGLDQTAIALLGGLIAAHRAQGGAIIAATHLPLPLASAATLGL